MNASWAYSYDMTGNRLSQTVAGNTGANSGTTTWTYNAADRLERVNGSFLDIDYDANGNEQANPGNPALEVPTRGSGYTPRDQVASITAKLPTGDNLTKYTYTGATNKLRLTAGATGFSHGQAGVTATTFGADTTGYTRLPDGTLLSRRTATGGSYYYLTDHQDSTIALVDASGARLASYAYDPYGATRAIGGGPSGEMNFASDNPYRYTGGYRDTETGLYKLGARYYDPALGRFTQPDPTGQDPHYTYARNNPVNFVDPNGDCAAAYGSLCYLGRQFEKGADAVSRYTRKLAKGCRNVTIITGGFAAITRNKAKLFRLTPGSAAASCAGGVAEAVFF